MSRPRDPEFDGIQFTSAEKVVLLRLVNRALISHDLKRMAAVTPLEERALEWARNRLHAAVHTAAIIPEVR